MTNQLIIDLTGYLAAIFGTALMLPQVYKTYKTKRVEDLSMVMINVYLINCALWLAYGIMLNSLPMILCNSIAEVIGLIQLLMKLKYTKQQSA